MAFYEIRHYTLQPGTRDEWVKYMEEVIIPFQTSKGMVINGSFLDEEDEDKYVWSRRFESEEQREELYAAVYQDDTWVNEISPKVGTMLIRDLIKVTRVVPTAASEIQ
ncbi:NIPSNAP family protein [Nakamurella leprariae]|uniref:NIPSNAP family protein n=1 Tax=Nakamurella leprariae TaxID=2803911 RepID=A0A939BZU9_9ACTN|nr:NIPSNAP family protein [Nakamurella leprariae]MBM9468550.1 NIPSNAP family protein [Nakamurella leprariae]